MISIDSDVLRSLVSMANTTLSEISTGVEKLNCVTTHDDWNCLERDYINEIIISAKKRINTLSVNTQTYLDLIRQSADKFDEADSDTTKAFQRVQDSLSDFFSIKSPVVHLSSGASSMQLRDTVYDSKRVSNFQTANIVKNIDSPIKVCYYSDLDFSHLNSEG